MCQTSVNLIPYLKKNTEQGPFVAKIPRLHMCVSIISLGKIKHQLPHDHPFSQRNKATERALGLDVGGKGGGTKGQNLKKEGGRQYRWVFIKQEG